MYDKLRTLYMQIALHNSISKVTSPVYMSRYKISIEFTCRQTIFFKFNIEPKRNKNEMHCSLYAPACRKFLRSFQWKNLGDRIQQSGIKFLEI